MLQSTALADIQPANILVRMPNWIGDCVMATPILADLHHHYPNAKITAMCQANIAPLIRYDPNIQEIFGFKKPSGWLRRSEHHDIVAPLRKGKYDVGILLTNSFSSAWWMWQAGVRFRIGYGGNLRSWLLTHAVPLSKDFERQHQVRTYKNLLTPLGIPLSDTSPRLYVTEEERREREARLAKHTIRNDSTVVGLNPGAAFGSAKCWLPERYREVIRRLLSRDNLYILVFGDKENFPLVEEICHGFPDRVVNLAGKTSLRELLPLIERCTVFLTNDSGPMHIASAFGTPLVALFGSTSEIRTGPYRGGKVVHKHVSCSPCYLRECPIDFRCMKEITVDEVMNLINGLIEDGKESSS